MDQPVEINLIEQCRSGDKVSFKKLVEIHQPFIYAVAFRLLCSNFESEEIVQETFIRVWKNLGSFNPEKQFRTWLYKITVNLCYDKMRAQRHLKNTIHPDNILLLNFANNENVEEEIINRDLAALILTLTGKLTPKQKVVFTLVEVEGFSFDEVSEITGLTHEKISSNLYCAHRFIKEKLECIDENADN